jgi:hypothetical protein
MELFLHPWYMVAGGALVSAPILIHLINRMRFKRVRWAAMEFLLKSQKRNRRRLIIEQLILLLLRILLVLLAAFLVARFVAGAVGGGHGATHVVILDDTPSMADRSAEATRETTAFEAGKEQIKQLARSAVQAPSAQRMVVLLLSDLDTTLFDQRLSDRSVDELHTALASRKPGYAHVDPVKAIEKGKAILNTVQQGQKVLHFVSDFRETDWVVGPGVENLNQTVDHLLADGIHLSLIDAAAPARGKTRKVALNHDNLAITDLKAEARVAAEGVPLEFIATVHNFSPSQKTGFLEVRVDGQPDLGATTPVPNLPPNESTKVKFQVLFIKKKLAEDVRPGDSREVRERKRRLGREFVQVTAQIKPEPTGLNTDNVRDMVIEVRKRVPTLVVDGNGPEGLLPGGDYFHLESAFAAAKSYEVERVKVEDLDSISLDLYPSIIFLNLPELKSTKALEKLDEYVKNGGSVCYFLGDRVRSAFYNDKLFKEKKGLFPLLIGDRPYNPIDPNGTLPAEEREKAREERKQKDPQPKILFRVAGLTETAKRIVENLAGHVGVFRWLSIDTYWRAQPRSAWDPERVAEEVVLLPNNRSMDDFKPRAQQLANQAAELTKELADANKPFARYVEPVERYRREVVNAASTPYLYNLARALDALLNDPGEKDNAARPDMPTLWAEPKMKALGAEIKELIDQVQYGDPLVVTRKHGQGRTVAVLTSAGPGSRWNDWGSGSPASWSYEVFMMDLQTYLVSEGSEFNRLVGDELTFQFDATRYLPKVKRRFQPQVDLDMVQGDGQAGPWQPVENQGEQALPMKDNTLTFEFKDAHRPGVYTFEFFPRVAEGGAEQTETRSYAFNIDAGAESNLKRAARDRLERAKPKDSRSGLVALRGVGDDFEVYRERQPDASESPWLYLLFLLILVVEQAMAVHLSFHLKSGEALPAAPARPAPSAAA